MQKAIIFLLLISLLLLSFSACKKQPDGSGSSGSSTSESEDSESSTPESIEPESSEPESYEPESSEPESSEPEPEPEPEEEPIDGGRTTEIDKDAPKKIDSKDISEFSLNIYLATRWMGDEDHFFEFQVQPDENGALMASELNSGLKAPADEELLSSLQAVIDKYGLTQYNGLYDVTAGLSPEYSGRTLKVVYASGEKLTYTVDNNPYELWSEEIYDIFAEWFTKKEAGSLYPEEETSTIDRLRLDFMENGRWYSAGTVNVQEDDAIDGQTYLIRRNIYDAQTLEDYALDFLLIPKDYYERLTEICAGYGLVRKYDFSYYDHEADNYGNHDEGYFGLGDKTTADHEPDSEDLYLVLYISYESGNSLSIETRKASEIEGIHPLIDELSAYYDSLCE